MVVRVDNYEIEVSVTKIQELKCLEARQLTVLAEILERKLKDVTTAG